MHIGITGGTGFIGQRLKKKLEQRGHSVSIFSRKGGTKPGLVLFDADQELIDKDALANMNAVIHLAGESIVGLWTQKKRKAIMQSRVEGTKFLINSISRLSGPKPALVGASAIGFYGDRPNEVVDTKSNKGEGFLADVCEAWELEYLKAPSYGIRTCVVRIGLVLSRTGGFLKNLLPLFKSGFAGPLGDGSSMMSWIDLDDLCDIFIACCENQEAQGIFNGVSPHPVTNEQFTKALAYSLNRPAIFRIPKCLLKLVGGEMAQNLILASTHVKPLNDEFPRLTLFTYPSLEMCLRRLDERI